MHLFQTKVDLKKKSISFGLFTAVILFWQSCAGQAAAVAFMNDRHITNNTGYVLLNWQNKELIPVELQQAAQSSFDNPITLYEGKNSSLMLSGLADGTYYYRIRAHQKQPGTWSDTVRLDVAHYSLARVWLLFVAGALVFLSVAWVIVRGAADES
ncbi:hypothetical protein SAMN05216326_1109 [Nitrosomonas marina]|uniref:Fibronectin type-III domain-containing protein n=2 Tax=Nitrosomonas marina TaxID=917 RepID=A0A1I0BA82_9PROT|nr:hypothetical protein SAMN05216326_1109 [Nitrosomonas marina]